MKLSEALEIVLELAQERRNVRHPLFEHERSQEREELAMNMVQAHREQHVENEASLTY